MTGQFNPVRGEVWDVSFDPQVGAEICKVRPAVVMSVVNVGRLPLRIVVPITNWDSRYEKHVWIVPIAMNSKNGLSKDSAADAFQIKSVSVDRFRRRRGKLLESQLDDIASAIGISVGI